MPVNFRLMGDIRLIEALWDTLPDDAMPPLSDEWLAEIQHRSAEYDAGTVRPIPWEKIRADVSESASRCRMKPVEFLPGARRDYDESFAWYGERSALAAERFTNAIDAALARIVADPEQFVRIDLLHRGCPVRRFPFRIIYRIEPNCILVVAVAHAKRHPDYWRNRE